MEFRRQRGAARENLFSPGSVLTALLAQTVEVASRVARRVAEKGVGYRIACAMTLMAGATALGYLLNMSLAVPVPFLTFLLAISACSWLAGRFWGIACILASLPGVIYFLPPSGRFYAYPTAGSFVALGVFVASGHLAVEVMTRLRQSLRSRNALIREVEAQRQLFQNIVDDATVAIAVHRGPDLVYQVVNPTYQAIAPKKVLIGKPVAEAWPEIAHLIVPLMQEVRRTGRSCHVEDQLLCIRRTPDGPLEDAFATFSVVPMPVDESGERAILKVLIETTEHVRARQALANLAAIVESTDDAVASLTVDGLIESWNEGARNLYGYDAAEVKGKSIAILAPPDIAATMPAMLAQLGSGQSVKIDETIRRRKDGTLIDVAVTNSPIKDQEGKVIGVSAITRDITERKRVEAERGQSAENLHKLVEISIQVVHETTSEGLLLAISDAARCLTGARIAITGDGYRNGHFATSAASRGPHALIPPGQDLSIEKGGIFLELLGSGGCVRLSDQALSSLPGWGLVEERTPLRGLLGVRLSAGNGEPDGMILVTDKAEGDFTAEEESLLLQLGAMASLALQHIGVRIKLEDADRRKDEFLAVLSHELRNPLAPIRNSLFVLEHVAPGSEDARQSLTIIDRQVCQMTRLIDDLLDVTRISRGKIQLQCARLDLNELLGRAVEDFKLLFEQSGVALQARLAPKPLWVRGDETRLAQVIGNLLQNAAKFTGRGGQTEIFADCDESTKAAVIHVRDNGIGIALAVLPRLFQPFVQAESTLSRSQGGLGLGLALVKGLVVLHGGTVEVKSDGAGAGTEFILRLPLSVGPAALECADSAVPAHAHHRILVIEDNADAAESLRLALGIDKHEVEVASDGPDGIAKARTFHPDVVLCDIGLPGMSGYEVAKAFRAEQALSSIYLVALSGYAMPADLARAKAVGFNQHLAKPLSFESLEKVLEHVPTG